MVSSQVRAALAVPLAAFSKVIAPLFNIIWLAEFDSLYFQAPS
jgi:hypothetical protein